MKTISVKDLKTKIDNDKIQLEYVIVHIPDEIDISYKPSLTARFLKSKFYTSVENKIDYLLQENAKILKVMFILLSVVIPTVSFVTFYISRLMWWVTIFSCYLVICIFILIVRNILSRKLVYNLYIQNFDVTIMKVAKDFIINSKYNELYKLEKTIEYNNNNNIK